MQQMVHKQLGVVFRDEGKTHMLRVLGMHMGYIEAFVTVGKFNKRGQIAEKSDPAIRRTP